MRARYSATWFCLGAAFTFLATHEERARGQGRLGMPASELKSPVIIPPILGQPTPVQEDAALPLPAPSTSPLPQARLGEALAVQAAPPPPDLPKPPHKESPGPAGQRSQRDLNLEIKTVLP